MRSDPYGLFPQQQRQQAAQPNSWSNLLLGIVIGVLGVFAFERFQDGGGFDQFDRDEQRDERQDDRQGVDADALIFLHEMNPQPIEHDLLMREMHDFTGKRNMQFRSLDDDLTDAPVPNLLTYAQTKGVMPPCVIITDKSKKPVAAYSWPEGDVSEQLKQIEGWLK